MVTQDFWDISGARLRRAGRLAPPREHEAVLLAHGFAPDGGFGGRSGRDRKNSDARTARQVAIVGVLPVRLPIPPARAHLGWVSGHVMSTFISQCWCRLHAAVQSGVAQRLSVWLKPGATLEGASAQDRGDPHAPGAEANPFALERLSGRLRAVPLHDELIGGAGLGARGARRRGWVCTPSLPVRMRPTCWLARAAARHKEIASSHVRWRRCGRACSGSCSWKASRSWCSGSAGRPPARPGEGVAVMLRIDPHAIPRLAETTIDSRVIAGVLAASGADNHHFRFGVGTHAVEGRPTRRAEHRQKSLVAGTNVVYVCAGSSSPARSPWRWCSSSATGLMLKSAWRMYAYPAGVRARAHSDGEGRVFRAAIRCAVAAGCVCRCAARPSAERTRSRSGQYFHTRLQPDACTGC